ncbi:hypothetical protein AB6A40_004488 [Gnathostoma spinigerum]|uniref:C2 domain-containing protein n=1 Tax=Gnathostoma spinigerum TaxID=75299 RepID=A0ABD6EKA6_9BILA
MNRSLMKKIMRHSARDNGDVDPNDGDRSSAHGVNACSKDGSDVKAGKIPDDMYVTFKVKIRLKNGNNLVIRDASGNSDPYVKFRYKTETYYKSNIVYKNLNPTWEEEFAYLIDDPTTPIYVDVYDYDRFAIDDYMGGAIVDLSRLRLFKPYDMCLELKEKGNNEEMGNINLTVTILALTTEEKEQFAKDAVRGVVSDQPTKTVKALQAWASVVNIVLLEAKDLKPPMNSKGLPDPYVKCKLGTEKYKSKPALRTVHPKWLEQFDLHLYDETGHTLSLMVHDKRTNLCMGKCSVDLDKIEKETTQQLACELDEGAGTIMLLISLTGTVSSDMVIDLEEFGANDVRQLIAERYALWRTFSNFKDVGQLNVKVFCARGLTAVDMGGKSDPFAVLELVNARLQTQTVYKSVNPEWNKLFTFAVKDINSILEVTIYDEDPNKKFQFLGKVAIPLLKIRNCEKRWYVLKDRKLRQRVKGQVLLELDVIWNPVCEGL